MQLDDAVSERTNGEPAVAGRGEHGVLDPGDTLVDHHEREGGLHGLTLNERLRALTDQEAAVASAAAAAHRRVDECRTRAPYVKAPAEPATDTTKLDPHDADVRTALGRDGDTAGGDVVSSR